MDSAGSPAEGPDAYDGAWKAGLDFFLPQMMELLFPAAHAQIDWSQPIVSLNSELRSLMPAENDSGRRERRRSFKLRLFRLLLQRKYERQRIEQLFLVIDWMMRLDKEQEIIFKQEATFLREDGDMSAYVNTFEKVARIEGRQEGRQEGAAGILRTLLARRFGDLPGWAADKLKAASAETLELWSVKVLDARRLEDVFA